MLKVTSPSYVPLISGRRRTAFMTLSNQSLTAPATTGTTVGNFAVVNGSTRTYTFSLTSNPSSLFTVSGSTLSVLNGPLSSNTYPITARASDTGTSVVTASFTILVSATSSAASPAMQFNVTTNSMYLPLLGGIVR